MKHEDETPAVAPPFERGVGRLRPKRVFVDAPQEFRCHWEVTLADGSAAQCGRWIAQGHGHGPLCLQHAKLRARWHCDYCGGNDLHPPGHCMDCSRPA